MKHMQVILMILMLAVLVAGCNDGPGGLAPADDASATFVFNDDGTSQRPTHAQILDMMKYETFTGSISHDQGGALLVTPRTWRPQCYFSILVPVGAVPEGPPVEFSIQVPTRESYEYFAEFDLPLIMRLGPENVPFSQPLMIQGTWMPWDDRTPNHYWYFVNGEQEEITQFEAVLMPSGLWNCRAWVDHFSDWEFGPIGDK